VTEQVRFTLASGGSVGVELDEVPGVSRAGRQNALVTAQHSLKGALAEVRDAAAETIAQFQEMAQQPDEVEIEFGVKLNAEAGAIIARTGMEGHFQVTLRWSRES
jgi:nicotinamide mononucleotide (NMN) deamidase PncC